MAGELSAVVQQFTTIKPEDTDAETSTTQQSPESQRIIRELDQQTPHTLDEAFSYKRPYGFVLRQGAVIDLVTWRNVLKSVCMTLADMDSARFESLPDSYRFVTTRGRKYFSRDASDLRDPVLIARGVYAEVNLSANQIRDVMRLLLDEYEIPRQELRLYLREDRNAEGVE